jgi:hypothetical protein
LSRCPALQSTAAFGALTLPAGCGGGNQIRHGDRFPRRSDAAYWP